MQPLSADEAQRLYEQKEEAEKVLSEQRLVEQERQQVRNEVLMRYNDGLRDVTAAVKQINEKVQWLSASLGSKFTVLDYEKSGTRSGLEAVERLTVQSKKLKVCMLICTVHAHIYVYIAPLHSFLHLHVSSPVDHGARTARNYFYRLFSYHIDIPSQLLVLFFALGGAVVILTLS